MTRRQTRRKRKAKALGLASVLGGKAGLVRTISNENTQAIEASIENEITEELKANSVMYLLYHAQTVVAGMSPSTTGM